MRFKIYFIEGEQVAVSFDGKLFLINPTSPHVHSAPEEGSKNFFRKTDDLGVPEQSHSTRENDDCAITPESKNFVVFTGEVKESPWRALYPSMPELEKEEDGILGLHLDEELSVKFYVDAKEDSAFLIRQGKFRIFYANSRYLSNVDSLELAIRDIKKFFVRKLDFAFLPLGGETDKVTDFLSKVKPKYLIPLLPGGNPGVVEDFVKDYQFIHTSVLLYSGNCEIFEFNLI